MKEYVLHNQVCEFCGGNFTAYRSTAKFCSAKCRAASHRQAAKFKTMELSTGISLLNRRSLKSRFELLMNVDINLLKMFYQFEQEFGSDATEQAFEIAWIVFNKYIHHWNDTEITRYDFNSDDSESSSKIKDKLMTDKRK